MMVNMGGHTRTGKVVHAVYGEWSYMGANESWCGRLLSGNDHKALGGVEVTCKRCISVVPTYPTEVRNAAHELLTAYRAGFDTGSSWRLRQDALLRTFPGWSEGSVKLARIVLSAAKPS